MNSSFKLSMIKGGLVNKMTFGKRTPNESREMGYALKNYLNYWMWEIRIKTQ